MGSWWRVVGLCFFVVVALFGVATCRGARRAKHKAREKALAELLSLMEEADEASRLDMQDLERNVAWIRGAGGLERLAIVRAVMPDGELATDLRVIARRYILGLFWVDIISSFPVNFIFYLLSTDSTGNALQVARCKTRAHAASPNPS